MLTVQPASRSANDLAWANPSGGGDTFINTGREAVLIKSILPNTVTIATPATVDGLAVADRVVGIGGNQTAFLGPFPRSTYTDPEGLVHLALGGTAGVQIAVIRI